MNLVQINERLKDLPMQVIQQYANGMNPEVPPYLALGELQRREMAQKQMANTQGAAQGPQPSIKEQVEQKAGLMAAQGLQQQQMMQQMAQPRGPMPAPAGIPQPEAQPEVAMARGGLAGIPVRRDMFEYASGGIIAFAKGETVEDPRRERKEGENFADFRKRMFALDLQLQREKNAARDAGREEERQRRLAERGEDFTVPPSPFMDRPPLPSPTGAPKAVSGPAEPANPADFMGGPAPAVGGLPDALANAAGATGVKPPAPPRPAAQPAAAIRPAAPTGLPSAIKAQSPLMDEALAMAREKPTAPTAEGIIAEQRKLMPAGMQDEARQKMLDDQRARAEERKATFERTKPSGLDDAIRVFGQSGQFKGGTGFAPAYTANQDRKRAQELGFQKEQDELLTAIDTRSSAFDSEVFGSREKSMTAATKAYQDRLLGNTKALADLAGVDQRRMDEAAGRLTQMQIAKLREATANKPTEAERIEANYMAMIAKGKPEEAEAYLTRISRIKGGGAAGVGSDRNRILDRRQEMQELSAIAKNEQGQFSDEDVKFAVDRIARLARENAKEDGGGAPAGAPPAQAIEALKKNPGLAAQFEQKYGKGAAAQYLQK